MVDQRLAVALWASLVSGVATFGIPKWLKPYLESRAQNVEAPATTVRKLPPITVPILSKGEVQGYVIAKLSFEADAKLLKERETPDPFVIDEAFRTIYGETGINFAKLERSDLQKLKADILRNVAARLNSDMGKDILFEEFNYVSKAQIGK